MKYENLYKNLQQIIDKAFKSLLATDNKAADKPKEADGPVYDSLHPSYLNIQEYTKKTGKRFRMTKDQKLRGLSRQAAFKEFTNILRLEK